GYVEPLGEVEQALAQIWQELLGVERVGRHDHFFELGGHSLLAIRLLNRMREKNMQVSLMTLLSNPILRDLAKAIRQSDQSSCSPFDANPVPINSHGHKPPLFLIHESSGDPLVYAQMTALLPPDQPAYVLQAQGINKMPNPPGSLEELASQHIAAIRRVQAHGPYHLAGWSIGGNIAYEMAQQLHQSGERIASLGMIDTYRNSHVETSEPTERLIDRVIDYLQKSRDRGGLPESASFEHFQNEDELLDYCFQQGWLPADVTKDDVLLRVADSNFIIRLGRRYIPSSSSVDITLYTSDENADENPWRGWKGYVGPQSKVHKIGGTHWSLMRPPLLSHVVDLMIDDLTPATPYDPKVTIQTGSKSSAPLFCIPGAGAHGTSFLELALAFPASLPIYALQARGLTNEQDRPAISVEGAARICVQAIRQVQPSGPYHLLGHSFGGWIAFEIALQLQRQGESVADLIILDSEAPDRLVIRKVADRIDTLMQLIDIYNMRLIHPLPIKRHHFDDRDEDEQINHLLSHLVRARIFPASVSSSLLKCVVQVMQANLNTSYMPRDKFNGAIHLVNAGDESGSSPHENNWTTLVEKIHLYTAPGNHMTMLSEPHVGQLVDKIWQHLSPRLRVQSGGFRPARIVQIERP
ncbi:alpha/beta fold hydrolase, partial [Pelomonas sp. P7]